MAPAIRLLAAAFLLPMLLARPAAGGDEAREVLYLFGLADHWKARYDSRIEPTLLAVDLTRPLPKDDPKADSPGSYGPWAIPVTDVLEITAKDDFPESLAAFGKRLGDSSAKHDDFVVAHSWIGSGNSDSRSFAPSLDRVKGARIVFAWGSRYGGKDKPFQLDYDHHRGGGLGIPFLAVERADLDAFAGDVRRYLRILTAKRMPEDLWRDIRAIPHEEIRYAAVRDVLDASYGFGPSTIPGGIGGLYGAPIGVREGFAHDLWAAAGDSPRRRLQAFYFYYWDRAPEVIEALLGDDFRWLLDLVPGDEPLAEYALGAAASEEGASVARRIGVDMVLASIDRPRGLKDQISTAIRILEASPPRHIPIERVRSIFAALAGTDGRTWSQHTSNGQPVELLLALNRVLPDLLEMFQSLPESDREAVKTWLRGLRVWAPPLAEPIRKARELFGV